MPEPYRLEKSLWTAADFDAMGWHDVRVHAIAHVPETWELLLDLDYIFEWNNPEPPSEYYSFWLAPATLVFQNVGELRFELEPLSGFQIERMRRSEPMPMRHGFHDPSLQQRLWTIDFFNGCIEFLSTGYQSNASRRLETGPFCNPIRGEMAHLYAYINRSPPAARVRDNIVLPNEHYAFRNALMLIL